MSSESTTDRPNGTSADARISFCAEQIRRYDPDRFMTCLFAPPSKRESLFALFAFNHEIAKVPEVVSEPMAGQIRLQWWREALDGLYAGMPRKHQVAEPLSEAIRQHDLSRVHFDRLLDAREQDLEEIPPADLDALEAYTAATSGTLVQLALEVLDARDEASQEAGRQVGIAWAMTGLIRAIPHHAAQKRLMMPGDIVGGSEMDPHDLFELRQPREIRTVVAKVAARAQAHLDLARAARKQVPKAARPALLPGSLAAGYLNILAKVDHDPFAERVQVRLPSRGWRLMWSNATGRF